MQGVRGMFVVLFKEEMMVILDFEDGNKASLLGAFREEEDL
jgi:hypothetical protein